MSAKEYWYVDLMILHDSDFEASFFRILLGCNGQTLAVGSCLFSLDQGSITIYKRVRFATVSSIAIFESLSSTKISIS